MQDIKRSKDKQDKRDVYAIHLKGHIDNHWIEIIETAQIQYEEKGETLIVFQAMDQSMLFGLLRRI